MAACINASFIVLYSLIDIEGSLDIPVLMPNKSYVLSISTAIFLSNIGWL